MATEDGTGIVEQTAVVILAGGKGTRMGRGGLPKVCFEIDGVPAINRVIATFAARSFAKSLVVVGYGAEQVKDTVNSDHPGVKFVHQEPQLGTGHAARIAAEALQDAGHAGYVLVTMGDKFIEGSAVQTLLKGFAETDADLALLTVPKTMATERSGGRVITDDSGQGVDIIEKTDVARQAIADELNQALAGAQQLTGPAIQEVINRHMPNPGKQAAAVGELLELAGRAGEVDKQELSAVLQASQYNIEIGGERYSAEQIEEGCKGMNPSLYLFKTPAFYQGVAMIDNDNAQEEYYLTDIVRHLASVKDARGKRKFRIRSVPIDEPDWIQGFNSPDELLAIQDYVRRKKEKPGPSLGPQLKANQYCTVSEWICKIEGDTPEIRIWLENIYGRHRSLHEQKRRDLMEVLRCYGERFGFEREVCIVRAPGRINLMGRHVDHRGGWNNCLAIDRETIAVAGIRADDNVEAVNVEPGRFGAVRFNIAEVMGRFAFADWLDFVNSDWVRSILRTTAGDWGNYIKAAMLRLQHQYSDTRIRGINLAVSGNVPIAAGLSSSSTIVVASLQAAIALNGLELTTRQFIDLCGQGEWFVGSRGGAGDHAAIRLGQRGKIAHVGYLPFKVEKMIDAPNDYQVVIANSHIKAAKSSSAKDTFNARIAAYNLGLELLKERCPQISAKIRCLRDVNPENLQCERSEIYRMLMNIPEYISREDFVNVLSAEHKDLTDANFASHRDPGRYNVRGVLLFGIAEILRSKVCVDYLEQGRIEQFGRLMKISHDGDRVSRAGPDEDYNVGAEQSCDDEYLNDLIGNLGSEDPARALKAQILMQPGGYSCSTVEIDQMVDIACSVPGVAGAQIAGAGLGGCIVVLARRDSVETLADALADRYYEPEGLDPEIIPCITAEGAGLADF
ncbi:MAG: NTP transferase domain-containing protein [Phycisphaerae bacterium]|nr:NTP transferase domain-containing protein [Phycisphaerae bacterium]